MKRLTILLVCLLSNTAWGQGEFLIEIDPTDGTFIKKSNSLGYGWVYPDVRAYDEVNGAMLFQFGNPTPNRLFRVDVTNGNVLSNPLFPIVTAPNSVKEPQYDNSTQTLYGLYHDYNTSAYYLSTIDPATGLHSQVGTAAIAGIDGLYQGMDTYDEIDHQYILYASGKIFSIDVSTGNTVSDPPIGLNPGEALTNLSFNNANDTLYGLLRNNNSQVSFLVWIDQSTGTISPIGPGTNLAAGNGSSTIDCTNRHFIYHYSQQGLYYISVMDMNDGSVLYNNQVLLDNQDNIKSIKYDNVRQKLFALHWDNIIDWPLGMSITSFTAQQSEQSMATLRWTVTSREANAQFCVEHSTDGKSFTPIARVMQQEDMEEYTATHAAVAGYNYYRIKVAQSGGATLYSSIVRITTTSTSNGAQLLPNIISSNTVLHIDATEQDGITLTVANTGGSVVYEYSTHVQKGENRILLDFSCLPSGTYTLYSSRDSNRYQALKFIKL